MKSNYDIALEVLSGAWGNGVDRRNRLTEAGFNYNDVQSIVNSLVKDGYLKNKPDSGKSEEKKDPQKNLLEIDYDPEKFEGIQVNVLV